jgi:hypothetical protein
MKKRTSPILVLLTLALVLPTTSHGATMWIDGDEIRYAAGGGELNHVGLDLQPSFGYTLQDQGIPAMEVLAPCTRRDLPLGVGSGGTCPAGGVDRALATLGNGHDRFYAGGIGALPIPLRLFGESGNDRLTATGYGDLIVGGAGQDDIEGRAGNDTIYAGDGEIDVVTCGEGSDQVTRDPADQIAADCETSFAGAPPEAPTDVPPTPTPPPLPPTQPPPPPPVTPIAFDATVAHPRSQRLRRALRAGIPVRVACNRQCDAQVRITVASAGRRGRLAGITVGARPVAIAAGEQLLRIPVNARSRRALRGLRSVRLRVLVAVRDRTATALEPVVYAGPIRLIRW